MFIFFQVKENSCYFSFDLRTCYWNSKRQNERKRFIGSIESNSKILDLFSGVGPLAISLRKHKKCQIICNDLNIHACEYIAKNCQQNQLPYEVVDSISKIRFSKKIQIFNIDAQLMLEKIYIDVFDHIIIDFPPQAWKFVKLVETRLLNSINCRTTTTPIICHFYCFGPQENWENYFQQNYISSFSKNMQFEFIKINNVEAGKALFYSKMYLIRS